MRKKLKIVEQCGPDRYGGFRVLNWAWQKVFFVKSIEIYMTNKNVKNINTFFKSVVVSVLCGLWAWPINKLALRLCF